MSKFDVQEMKGVIPALMTVFAEDETIDESGMRELVDHLINKGVNGLYLTGSTGEGFLMSMEERKKVVEIVIDEADNRVPIMVHVGTIGTKNSIKLAEHAYEKGADAVSSVPPFYWNFDEEHIYNYYKDIAEATPLPMIVYNIKLAGTIAYDSIKKLAAIENVKGIKYTATSHFEIASIKDELGEDFLVYSGADEMASSGLFNGADGLIGSFYNLMPELFMDIYEAVNNNDLKTARIKQQNAVRIIKYSVQYDFYSLMRLALGWLGVNAGYSRRPFKNYGAEKEAEFKAEFKKLKDKYQIEGIDFLDAI